MSDESNRGVSSAMGKINKAIEGQDPKLGMVIVPFLDGKIDISELYECRAKLLKIDLQSEIEESNGRFYFTVRW